MLIDTETLLEYRLKDCDVIYDCQFCPENVNRICFSSIEGNIEM